MADNVAASYRVLGLESGATPEQVRRAYHALIKAWHPDRFPHDARLRAQAHAKAAELIAAYARVREHLRTAQASPAAKEARPASSASTWRAQRAASSAEPSTGPDNSHRDFANATLIRCSRCGSNNIVPDGSRAPRCHRCGNDLLEQRHTKSSRCATRPVTPELRGIEGHRDLPAISRIAGIIGLAPGLLLAGVVAVATAPAGEDHSAQAIAVGVSLLALLVGSAAVVVTLLLGDQRSHIAAGFAVLLSLSAGFAAVATAAVPGDSLGLWIALALCITILVQASMASAIALGAARGTRRWILIGACGATMAVAFVAMFYIRQATDPTAQLGTGRPMVAHLSLLLYAGVMATTVLGTRNGDRPAHSMAVGLSVFSTVAAFVALLTAFGENAHVGVASTGPVLWIFVAGATAVAMAGIATAVIPRAEPRHWQATIDGLALGITDLIVAIVFLSWCR